MKIKIWGSRGAMPVSGENFSRYGGATTCVEVFLDNGVSILFDAGTGISAYDAATPKDKKSRVICLTHAHYGHTQGLPFFSGALDKKTPCVIMGPAPEAGGSFQDSLEGMFDGVRTPVKWSELPAHYVMEIKGHEKYDVYGAIVQTCPTLHPGGCLALKITADGWTFAITGDHEIPLDKSDTDKNIQNEKLMGFLAGCDIVLADAHFTREDHLANSGAGHSDPFQWQQELADRGVGKICFTHFNPAYDDKKVDALLTEAKKGAIPCDLAHDGAVIDKEGCDPAPKPRICSSCEFNRKVANFSDTHAILDAMLTSARTLANAEGGTVYLVAGGELNFAAAQNDRLFPATSANKFAYFKSRLPLDKSSIAGYVAKTGQALNIEDVYALPENSEFTFNSSLDKASGYRTVSVLAVPLTNAHDAIIGVLQLINARDFHGYGRFGARMADEISKLAKTATIPLERSFLAVTMILRLLKTAALRDPAETPGHARRVGAIAAELYHHWAAKRKTDPEEILFTKGQLRLAAMLHDVGKVGVPDAILNKTSRLDDQERKIMERHAFLGANLFQNSDHIIDKMAQDIALHHHARWDGDGYTGRSDIVSPGGTEIPIWARLTTIADVFDAMVSPRAFRKAWTNKEAGAYLRQEAGKRFDPELVDNFREIMNVVRHIRERFPDSPPKR